MFYLKVLEQAFSLQNDTVISAMFLIKIFRIPRPPPCFPGNKDKSCPLYLLGQEFSPTTIYLYKSTLTTDTSDINEIKINLQ